MQTVRTWREQGDSLCYTLDAGPNVHCLCPADVADEMAVRLRGIPGVLRVLAAGPGGPARLLDPQDPLLGLL
jgi:diphosphomevalonate decarboxylase